MNDFTWFQIVIMVVAAIAILGSLAGGIIRNSTKDQKLDDLGWNMYVIGTISYLIAMVTWFVVLIIQINNLPS